MKERRPKPERAYHVAIMSDGRVVDYCSIYGETFFAARAKFAAVEGIEPGDILLHPERKHGEKTSGW